MNTSRLAQNIYLAEQVKEFEIAAANRLGMSSYELMQKAGQRTFIQCQTFYPDAQRYLIFVGIGNNAGDGYIVAACALKEGKQVLLVDISNNATLPKDAQSAKQTYLALQSQLASFQVKVFEHADIIIDAMFGTGINRALNSEIQYIINSINESSLPVVSIDVPSGLLADQSALNPVAVEANISVCMIALKPALVTGVGKQYAGRVIVEDLGISAEFRKLAKAYGRIYSHSDLPSLPPRKINTHKGSYGKVLCIGGNRGMSGAIRLSAQAALRAGAGMVKVFCHEDSVLNIAISQAELMVVCEQLMDSLDWSTSVVLGPGLGQDAWAKQVFQFVIQYLMKMAKPCVIDADALNLISQSDIDIKSLNAVLTPHSAEAARLLNKSTLIVEQNRYLSVEQLRNKYHQTIVLKGPGTIVFSEDDYWVCKDGNAGMASAGMGDVLTGIMIALIAQGLELDLAAKMAVSLHARAADIQVGKYGIRGLLASDLISQTRSLINNLNE